VPACLLRGEKETRSVLAGDLHDLIEPVIEAQLQTCVCCLARRDAQALLLRGSAAVDDDLRALMRLLRRALSVASHALYEDARRELRGRAHAYMLGGLAEPPALGGRWAADVDVRAAVWAHARRLEAAAAAAAGGGTHPQADAARRAIDRYRQEAGSHPFLRLELHID
jgi:hypothetical protein